MISPYVKLGRILYLAVLFVVFSKVYSFTSYSQPIGLVLPNKVFDKPLPIQSHNDYSQDLPLYTALSHSVKVIEVDVHLINDDLFVAHHLWQVHPGKRLENLYLEPLFKIIDNNQSYSLDSPLYLLIDFKSDGKRSLKVLNRMLKKYRKNIEHYVNEKAIRAKVKIIITGYRPIQMILKDKNRNVFIDGRLSEVRTVKRWDLYPMVSDNWSILNSKWGVLFLEREEFQDLSQTVYNNQSYLRLWATPDDEKTWTVLRKIKNILINTDKPIEVSRFFHANKFY